MQPPIIKVVNDVLSYQEGNVNIVEAGPSGWTLAFFTPQLHIENNFQHVNSLIKLELIEDHEYQMNVHSYLFALVLLLLLVLNNCILGYIQ